MYAEPNNVSEFQSDEVLGYVMEEDVCVDVQLVTDDLAEQGLCRTHLLFGTVESKKLTMEEGHHGEPRDGGEGEGEQGPEQVTFLVENDVSSARFKFRFF